MKLRSEGVDDRSDKERTEQSLRHCGECVDAVSPGADLYVLAFKESAE